MGIINSISHKEPDSDMLINVFKVTHLLRGENRSQTFVSLFPELFPQQCSNAILLFSHSGMSNSLWPQGLQHARLLCPLPSLGVCSNSCPLCWWFCLTISSPKPPSPFAFSLSQNQGQSNKCLCAKSSQSCPTLCDPMNYSPPGSSVHGILQATILEWVVISFSRASSLPRV